MLLPFPSPHLLACFLSTRLGSKPVGPSFGCYFHLGIILGFPFFPTNLATLCYSPTAIPLALGKQKVVEIKREK